MNHIIYPSSKQGSIYIVLVMVSLTFVACRPRYQKSNPDSVVKDFYDNYIATDYHNTNSHLPAFSIDSTGVGFLDTTRYFAYLRAKEVFSASYFRTAATTIADCNLYLARVDSTILSDYAAPWEDIPQCGFMNFTLGVGCSGDVVEGIKIVSITAPDPRSATVRVEAIGCSSFDVSMCEVEGKWLIDSINPR